MKKPSKAELEEAQDRSVPDLVKYDLRLLIVGINPSLSSGATGFHFATPGNRLWPALHGAGLTASLLDPSETGALLGAGIGITNLVNRSTRTAAEVRDEELRSGALALTSLVETYRPRAVAVLGLGASRRAFQTRHAQVGRQPADVGPSQLWVLPNPSGINAYYTIPRLVELFRQVAVAIS